MTRKKKRTKSKESDSESEIHDEELNELTNVYTQQEIFDFLDKLTRLTQADAMRIRATLAK